MEKIDRYDRYRRPADESMAMQWRDYRADSDNLMQHFRF